MGIRVECENCGHAYHLKDTLAGRKVKCKICRTTFIVPPSAATISEPAPGGGVIYRHAPRDKEFELAVGDPESIKGICDHIERHLGKIDIVWHEVLSELVHVDVHWIKPTSTRPYHTLVTTGMSDRPMQVPAGAEAFRYAELLICLPPEWQISQTDFAQEQWYWPVRWLKILARFPHEYDTWLGLGHTIPNEDPPQPFAANTQLCCSLLMPPLLVPDGFARFDLDSERQVRFYALVPLYREEMEFKLQQGLDPLIDRLDKQGVNELLNIRRKNVCRRGWW